MSPVLTRPNTHTPRQKSPRQNPVVVCPTESRARAVARKSGMQNAECRMLNDETARRGRRFFIQHSVLGNAPSSAFGTFSPAGAGEKDLESELFARVQHSTFDIHHSTFNILHSAFAFQSGA